MMLCILSLRQNMNNSKTSFFFRLFTSKLFDVMTQNDDAAAAL